MIKLSGRQESAYCLVRELIKAVWMPRP
ncbi:unnamed protein product [Fusarium graminearum]|nr:unnamed protein product [Fusarium graminearum]VTO85622.1 unnamed protein product [Fusarium graminearum]